MNKELKQFLTAFIVLGIAGVLAFVFIAGEWRGFNKANRKTGAIILDSLDCKLGCEPVVVDPAEVDAAFAIIRRDMIATTFSNYAGSEDAKKDDAIRRLSCGLRLAEECKEKIKGKR